MKRRVHPVTGILVVAIAILLAVMWQNSRLDREGAGLGGQGTGQPVQAMMPMGPPEPVPTLGIMWVPGQGGTRGIGVDSLLNDPVPSRLGLAGVRMGDIILGANDDRTGRMDTIDKALDALITKGTPFTLHLKRQGQEMDLKVTKLNGKALTTAEILKVIERERSEATGVPPLQPAPETRATKGAKPTKRTPNTP